MRELLIAFLLGRLPKEKASMIPLGHAALCLDCEFIVHAKQNRCSHCDSTALMSVSSVLGRNPAGAMALIHGRSFEPRKAVNQ